jgi:hypothetical protein
LGRRIAALRNCVTIAENVYSIALSFRAPREIFLDPSHPLGMTTDHKEDRYETKEPKPN